MSTRKKFEDKIAKCDDIIEKANVEREIWVEALKLLPKEGPANQKSPGRGFRAGSEMERAQKYLQAQKTPLHIGAIITGIGKEDTKENRTNLQSQMNSHAKNGNVFTRPAPGTYGLIEFEEKPSAEDFIG